MVASPGLLAHAPHTHIATVRVAGAGPGRACCARSPTRCRTSPASAVADVLAAVAALLDQVAAALAATGSLALAAGALVLVGAVAAGQRRRTAEAVILKTLGATRGQIRAAWLVEFGLLGLAAGMLAALVGTAASYAVLHYIMHAEWVFLPGTLAETLHHGARHDAGFRLRWHCGGASEQGGAVAAQRMKKLATPWPNDHFALEPPRSIAKMRARNRGIAPERKGNHGLQS